MDAHVLAISVNDAVGEHLHKAFVISQVVSIHTSSTNVGVVVSGAVGDGSVHDNA